MNVLEELNIFYNNFSQEKGYIGTTEMGKPIPFLLVKKTPFPRIIVQYSIHAREYITTYLAMQQILHYQKYGKSGSVYFIPAVNLDGIEKVLNGNPLYKANINGVDLNVNFDANWGTGKTNIRYKNFENYIGEKPFSESETIALKNFTLSVMPHATISYHSKGEEVYWEFFQQPNDRKRDEYLAQKLARATGYSLKSTPDSAGGYKDWCIQKLKIPAFTIEVGDDNLTHPIQKKHLPEIFDKNKEVINTLIESLGELI